MTRNGKLSTIMLGLVLATMVSFAPAAWASNEGVERVYKIQVQYWFFDSDFYKWETFFETTDVDTAIAVLLLMIDIKEDGNLQHVAPNAYWRYVPVDVRLVTTDRLKPQATVFKSAGRYRPAMQ